jgi:glucans biosynthesis protein
LKAIPETAPPQAIASCSTNAAIVDNQVFFNLFNDSWRVMLKMEPKPGNNDPVDIRCTLNKGEEVLSETWTYHWSPP